MNELIIRNWNEVVRSDDDIVIVLGDFILGSNVQTKEIAEQLRGTIYLIRGNHDEYKHIQELKKCCNVKLICDYAWLTTAYNHKQILLLHGLPPYINEKGYPLCIHGHLHHEPSRFYKGFPTLVNVNCDLFGYRPIDWNTLMREVVYHPPTGYTVDFMCELWDYPC
jgi:calcineurin-like phosphoesterase family protein